VAEFTRDVPLVRVLRATDVADTKVKKSNGMAEVDAATTVEDLLPLLARNKEGVAVKGPRGRILGVASAQTVVKALAVEGAKREEVSEAAS
jgi:glycine betaine/proline transport system ATP-binding protein